MDYRQKIEAKRQKMVDTLITYIENNPTEWIAGWYGKSKSPINAKTEKAYKGLNAFYLMVLSVMRGYSDPRWLTFNQAKELGANVKLGEKSSEIFYWSFYDKKTKKPFDERTVEDMTYEERREYLKENVRPVIKFYQVFNAEQCDNMPEYSIEAFSMNEEERERQNAIIEEIIANSEAPVNYDGGNSAYYSLQDDSIHLPEINVFKTMQDYYATALHEISHSTGHEKRLNRNMFNAFGSEEYAKEELRAELASVFMQVDYGINIEGKHFENHGAYLASWLKEVKDNHKEFFAAASDAEKIAKYISENYLEKHKEKIEEQYEQYEQYGQAEAEKQNRTSVEIANERLRQAKAEAKQRGDSENRAYVVIEWSESKARALRDNTVMTFEEANDVLGRMNDVAQEELGYYKTKLHIYCPNENGGEWYNDCRFDIGSEAKGGLVKHIQDFAKYVSPEEALEIDKFIMDIQKLLAHEAGLPFSDKPFDSLEEDNPYVYDGSMSVEDYKLMLKEQENTKEKTVAEWYKETYPTDELGLEINETLMFEDLFEVKDEDIYKAIGVGDSVIRERIEQELVERYEMAKKAEEYEQYEQDKQYKQAEQAEQYEQVRNGKWQTLEIPKENLGQERGKSVQIKLPNGEYSSFVFFAPTKFIQKDEASGSVKLTVNSEYKYNLMKGNQRVELNGTQLKKCLQGETVGVKARRVLSDAHAQRLSDIYLNVPEEMRSYPNWCVYKTKWNTEKGKYDKQIYSPTLGISDEGKMQWASIDKPETWGTFDEAMQFAKENDCAGLVFALNGNGISCIDLDKSIVKDGKLNDIATDKPDGELSVLAARLCDEMQATYIETSASGNGLHIFVKDDLLNKGKYKNRVETPDGELEVYDEKRFISMTGNLRSKTVGLSKSPVATTQWLQKQLGEKISAATNNVAPSRKSSHIDNSDSAVIERIERSKKGSLFKQLYNGADVTGDNSRNDFMLLNMLAFFTDCDTSQMERIFKSSALYRPEKGEQYVQRSVGKACTTLQTRMSNRAVYGGGSNRTSQKGK